jgi:hypothetical protein
VDVCSSVLLISAILGYGRTEPPLKPLSEFAEPALNAHFKWDVEVSVISERSRFVVDDVLLSGNSFSQQRMSFYELFPGCNGLSWSGK